MIFWHREPWIMHSNLLLCWSHTPLSTSPSSLSFFTPAPSLSSSTFFSPSLLPLSIFTIHPHQSSASFCLSPPRPSHPIYPLLSSPSTFHPPSIRQQTGNAAGSDRRFHCRTLTVSVFIIQVAAQVAAAHSCICIFMDSELGHWQDFFSEVKRAHSFCRPQSKNTVEASLRVVKTLMWMGKKCF